MGLRYGFGVLVILVLAGGVHSEGQTNDTEGACYNHTDLPPFCQHVTGFENYQFRMPNVLGHDTPDEAGLEVHQFYPLIRVQCSEDLGPFLCTFYYPPCAVQGPAALPCRELCESARQGCELLMTKFGFSWPKSLDCGILPAGGDGARCFDPTKPVEEEELGDPDPASSTSANEEGQDEITYNVTSSNTEDVTSGIGSDEMMAMVELTRQALEVLQLQRENLVLTKQKLKLEIALLQRQLEAGSESSHG